jgi:hypothetical protein
MERATEGDTMGDGRGRWSEGRTGMIGARIELMIQIIPGLDYTLSPIIQKTRKSRVQSWRTSTTDQYMTHRSSDHSLIRHFK